MKFNILSISITCLIFFSFLISGQSQDQSANWFTNKEDIQSAATENENNILMVFAGSDWCRPCIKFKKDILMDEDFVKLNHPILYLDFPAKKKNKLSKEHTKHNEALADEYNRSGSFPKIILLDSAFNTIKTIEYSNQTAADFIAQIQ